MGFYYDEQMRNPSITCRLYRWDKDKGTYLETKDGLIATSIVSDDFNFNISNEWINAGASGGIDGIWDSLRKMGIVGGELAGIIHEAFTEDQKFDSKVLNEVYSVLKKVSDLSVSGKAKDYINSALISQTSRFRYYGGTTVDLGGISMKYTEFYDPITDTPVNNKVSNLFQYSIGKVKKFSEVGDVFKEGSPLDEAAEKAEEYFAWQVAPNEFEANIKNINNPLPGTFKMWIGEMYYIDNLVIKDISVTMSKIKVKRTRVRTSISELPTPLYAEITITLEPAGMILENTLSRYINSTSTSSNTSGAQL